MIHTQHILRCDLQNPRSSCHRLMADSVSALLAKAGAQGWRVAVNPSGEPRFTCPACLAAPAAEKVAP